MLFFFVYAKYESHFKTFQALDPCSLIYAPPPTFFHLIGPVSGCNTQPDQPRSVEKSPNEETRYLAACRFFLPTALISRARQMPVEQNLERLIFQLKY